MKYSHGRRRQRKPTRAKAKKRLVRKLVKIMTGRMRAR